jgi:Heterokaryon incompatibility protein (HET)
MAEILSFRERGAQTWSYSNIGVPGAFRGLLVKDLLSPGSKVVRLFEWTNIEWSRAETIPKYAAISHVWKLSPDVEKAANEANEPLKVDIGNGRIHTLSTFGLGQAATAAKYLGCEYIWLDLLSINQQSHDDKVGQIKQMGNIYKSASAVLIMLGGVSAAQRMEMDSSWIDRAWTLQEATLCSNTYCLVAWPYANVSKTDHWDYRNVKFTRLDGNIAISEIKGFLQLAQQSPPNRVVANVNDTEQLYEFQFEFPVKGLGNSRAAIDALTAVLYGLQVDPDDSDMSRMRLYAAAWRSMWLRTSTKPQDMVFSMLHLLGADIQVDYSRSQQDLIFELAAKTEALPAWLTIGEDIPINPKSGLLAELPIFMGNTGLPKYQIQGKDLPTAEFIAEAYVTKFHMEIKFSSPTDGHLVCAPFLRLIRAWEGATTKNEWLKMHLYSAGNNFITECYWASSCVLREGDYLMVVGNECPVYGFGYFGMAAVSGPLVYLLSRKDKVWQRCGAGVLTLDETQLKKVTDNKGHLRIGGTTGAEAHPGPCDCN